MQPTSTASPIPVLFCIDGNFWQHLGVSAASLLKSNPNHTFRILVASSADMDSARVEELRSVITAAGNGTLETVVYREASQYEHLPTHSHLTFAMYLRLFMTEFLDPALDKILYLDSDLVVCGDLAELWNLDLGDAYVGGVREPYDRDQRTPFGFRPEDLYINSGVLLINLRKWRADNVLPKLLAFAVANSDRIFSPDQDTINCVFRGSIRDIGYQWNWQALFARLAPQELGISAGEFRRLRRSPKIVHFTSRYKPWYYRWAPHYRYVYWRVLAETPWAKYSPPDKSIRNIPVKWAKLFQQQLEWHLPSVARKLRDLRGSKTDYAAVVSQQAQRSVSN